MLKIKVFSIAGVLGLAIFVLNMSPVFVSNAESDVILNEIAGYKNWRRINKEPIKIPLADKHADGNFFIVDGKEVRIGDLGS
jgi:hypothetical protein